MKKLEFSMGYMAVVLFLGRFAYLTWHRLLHPNLWSDWKQDPRIVLELFVPIGGALIYEWIRGYRIRRAIEEQQRSKL